MTESKTILVADDEPDIREALTTGLRNADFHVLEAADGKAALALALKQKPDLILLDIQMPVMNGTDMLRELRKDEWGAEADVIVLTAHTDINNLSDVIEIGGGEIEYLIKTDWKLSDVVERVKKRLEVE